jgi:hypothetical protein
MLALLRIICTDYGTLSNIFSFNKRDSASLFLIFVGRTFRCAMSNWHLGFGGPEGPPYIVMVNLSNHDTVRNGWEPFLADSINNK